MAGSDYANACQVVEQSDLGFEVAITVVTLYTKEGYQ